MADVLESQKPGTASVEADAQLAAMGYRSELPRNLSMMSILGMSFAIMGRAESRIV